MNTNTVIGIIVAIVVIGGGAWYFSMHPMQAPTGTEGAAQGTGDAAEGTTHESGTLSYGQILLMGGSQQCDISLSSGQGPATGKLYISGANVRSDIAMGSAAGNINAHMIRTGGYIYSWTDMINQGVKIQESAATQTSGGNASTGYDASAAVSYSCQPWIADSGKFSVPANITFMTAGGASAKP